MIERLGLEVVEIDRPIRPEGPSFPEAEFIATGMSGAEFPFHALGPHLRHTILLSGFSGGDMWGLKGPVSRTGRQDDTSGASMAEFRLRCGFVHLPVAWIGFESLPELRQLCHSEAMKAWRTGTGYERPIARRIVEESGVPRGSFGTSKRATSISFNYAPFWWSGAALAGLRGLERQHAGAWREWPLIALTAWREPPPSRLFSRCGSCATWSVLRNGSTTCARGWSPASIAWS